jgi:hypothetical protein
MRQLIGELLRGDRVLYESVRNPLRVGGGRVEGYSCRCKGVKCLFAFGGKARFQSRQYLFVVLVPLDLPL